MSPPLLTGRNRRQNGGRATHGVWLPWVGRGCASEEAETTVMQRENRGGKVGDPGPGSLEVAPEPCTEVNSRSGRLGGQVASHLWEGAAGPSLRGKGSPGPRSPSQVPRGGGRCRWGRWQPTTDAGRGALAGGAPDGWRRGHCRHRRVAGMFRTPAAATAPGQAGGQMSRAALNVRRRRQLLGLAGCAPTSNRPGGEGAGTGLGRDEQLAARRGGQAGGGGGGRARRTGRGPKSFGVELPASP